MGGSLPGVSGGINANSARKRDDRSGGKLPKFYWVIRDRIGEQL